MKMDNNNPPAFPNVGDNTENYQVWDGMSLRDYFAAKAMQGDWAAQSQFCGEFEHNMPLELLDRRAVLYYRMADAMLATRSKQI